MAVTALAAVTALSACSGDDGDGSPSSGSTKAAPSESESATIYPVDSCKAKVKVSGPVKVSWSGNGSIGESDGSPTYQSSNNKSSWFAFTDADKPNVTVTVKGATYNAPPKGVDIERADNGVTVRAELPAAKGKASSVTATFDCKAPTG